MHLIDYKFPWAILRHVEGSNTLFSVFIVRADPNYPCNALGQGGRELSGNQVNHRAILGN